MHHSANASCEGYLPFAGAVWPRPTPTEASRNLMIRCALISRIVGHCDAGRAAKYDVAAGRSRPASRLHPGEGPLGTDAHANEMSMRGSFAFKWTFPVVKSGTLTRLLAFVRSMTNPPSEHIAIDLLCLTFLEHERNIRDIARSHIVG